MPTPEHQEAFDATGEEPCNAESLNPPRLRRDTANAHVALPSRQEPSTTPSGSSRNDYRSRAALRYRLAYVKRELPREGTVYQGARSGRDDAAGQRHADDDGDLPSARHGRSLMKCAPIPKGRGVE